MFLLLDLRLSILLFFCFLFSIDQKSKPTTFSYACFHFFLLSHFSKLIFLLFYSTLLFYFYTMNLNEFPFFSSKKVNRWWEPELSDLIDRLIIIALAIFLAGLGKRGCRRCLPLICLLGLCFLLFNGSHLYPLPPF